MIDRATHGPQAPASGGVSGSGIRVAASPKSSSGEDRWWVTNGSICPPDAELGSGSVIEDALDPAAVEAQFAGYRLAVRLTARLVATAPALLPARTATGAAPAKMGASATPTRALTSIAVSKANTRAQGNAETGRSPCWRRSFREPPGRPISPTLLWPRALVRTAG